MWLPGTQALCFRRMVRRPLRYRPRANPGAWRRVNERSTRVSKGDERRHRPRNHNPLREARYPSRPPGGGVQVPGDRLCSLRSPRGRSEVKWGEPRSQVETATGVGGHSTGEHLRSSASSRWNQGQRSIWRAAGEFSGAGRAVRELGCGSATLSDGEGKTIVFPVIDRVRNS